MKREDALNRENYMSTAGWMTSFSEAKLIDHINKIFDFFQKKLKTQSEQNIKLINDYHDLLEQSCTDCKWCKLGGEDENDECHNTSLSAHLSQGTMVCDDFSCNRWEKRDG